MPGGPGSRRAHQVDPLAVEDHRDLLARLRGNAGGSDRPAVGKRRLVPEIGQRDVPAEAGGTEAALGVDDVDRDRQAAARARQVERHGRAVASRGVHRAFESGVRGLSAVVPAGGGELCRCRPRGQRGPQRNAAK